MSVRCTPGDNKWFNMEFVNLLQRDETLENKDRGVMKYLDAVECTDCAAPGEKETESCVLQVDIRPSL